MIKLTVDLESHSSHAYDICIGRGILDRIALLASHGAANRHIVISDSHVSPLYGESLLSLLRNLGKKADLITFPAGESSKNMDTVLAIITQMIELGADRGTELIALGGGVTGDMVSFIASIYMRSVTYVQIPTTLMSQVDSCIGGKTGIDLAAGKNLLGTFYQPRETFIDLQFLDTLPEREFLNGMAEVVKYAIIDDLDLLDLLERHAGRIRERDPEILTEIVTRSCRIKKGFVEIDEKDRGLRRILNFGHTIGHAIEAESDYDIPHGHALSPGMIAAARISEKHGYLASEECERMRDLIQLTGLPPSIPERISTEGILSRIRHDKKKEGETVHFVLLKKLGMPFMNGSVEEELIREIIEELKQ